MHWSKGLVKTEKVKPLVDKYRELEQIRFVE